MINDTGLRESDIAAIRDILRKYPEVERCILFGSRAKGNYHQGSDVDMALQGEALCIRVVARIAYALNEESLMPYQFDLVDMASIQNPALLEHIQRVGVLIYAKNEYPLPHRELASFQQ